MLFFAECRLVEAHGWFLTEARLDGKHVKPPIRIFQAASAKKLPSHSRQVATLLRIHGVFRPRLPQLSRSASFDFHKCKHGAVVPNDVEFTFHSRHCEIPGDYDVTLVAKIPV